MTKKSEDPLDKEPHLTEKSSIPPVPPPVLAEFVSVCRERDDDCWHYYVESDDEDSFEELNFTGHDVKINDKVRHVADFYFEDDGQLVLVVKD